MKPQHLNRIAELRLVRNMSQSDLAHAVGAHKITISKLERGEMNLTQSWMQRLSAALDVTPAELLSDFSLIRTVYITGRVDDNMTFLSPGEIIPSLQVTSIKQKIDFGSPPSNVSIFLRCETNIFEPIMHFYDIVRFMYIPSIESTNKNEWLYGRLGIVEIENTIHMLIGVIERGAEPGTIALRHPVGGYKNDVRPGRIYILNLVLGLPGTQFDEMGDPL